jgi:hypothetical protein
MRPAQVAQTAFGPIVFGPFEYLAQTAKINYSVEMIRPKEAPLKKLLW